MIEPVHRAKTLSTGGPVMRERKLPEDNNGLLFSAFNSCPRFRVPLLLYPRLYLLFLWPRITTHRAELPEGFKDNHCSALIVCPLLPWGQRQQQKPCRPHGGQTYK